MKNNGNGKYMDKSKRLAFLFLSLKCISLFKAKIVDSLLSYIYRNNAYNNYCIKHERKRYRDLYTCKFSHLA